MYFFLKLFYLITFPKLISNFLICVYFSIIIFLLYTNSRLITERFLGNKLKYLIMS